MILKARQTGVTLLELILVMIVLCTVLAMASPSLRGFFTSRADSDLAHTMSALMNYASTQAVSEGNYYRFNFNEDQNKFWLTYLYESNYELLENDYGKMFDIPKDIEVDVEDMFRYEGSWCIEFTPLGTKTICRMRLTNPQKEITDILCLSSTEPFQVIEYTPNEREIRYKNLQE